MNNHNHQYALLDNELININNVDKSLKQKYHCAGCKSEMIAKKGKIKVHHFAHKSLVNCSGETYLHFLSKTLIYNKLKECITNKEPFFLEYKKNTTCNHFKKDLDYTCDKGCEEVKVNLIDYYDEVYLENRVDNFIPDVYLRNSKTDNKLFIEIAVTHYSSDEKLNSKYRIIEISVKSEDDLIFINENKFSEKYRNIEFFNFKLDIEKSLCNGNCSSKFDLFIYRDKEDYQLKIKNTPNQLLYYKKTEPKIFFQESSEEYVWNFFKRTVYDLKDEGIRNCYLCRYVGSKTFCKIQKKQVKNQDAKNCKYFRTDKK